MENTSSKNVDIVLCIDGTGSMVPCIGKVKDCALNFAGELSNELVKRSYSVDSLRVKVIVFRDYGCDSEPMTESRFFELPADEADYQRYVAGISATGGGDGPENGLEALYYAMKSDFIGGPSDRQVIVMFTDAEALELGERKSSPKYPTDMPDMAGLVTLWSCAAQDSGCKLDERARRLVIFAPDGTKYKDLQKSMQRCYFQPVSSGSGMKEIDMGAIIKIIAASASARS